MEEQISLEPAADGFAVMKEVSGAGVVEMSPTVRLSFL